MKYAICSRSLNLTALHLCPVRISLLAGCHDKAEQSIPCGNRHTKPRFCISEKSLVLASRSFKQLLWSPADERVQMVDSSPSRGPSIQNGGAALAEGDCSLMKWERRDCSFSMISGVISAILSMQLLPLLSRRPGPGDVLPSLCRVVLQFPPSRARSQLRPRLPTSQQAAPAATTCSLTSRRPWHSSRTCMRQLRNSRHV